MTPLAPRFRAFALLLATAALAPSPAARAANGSPPPPAEANPPAPPCPSTPDCVGDDGLGVELEALLDPDYGLLGAERFTVVGRAKLLDPLLLHLQVHPSVLRSKDDEQVQWMGLFEPDGPGGLRFRWILNAASRGALAAKMSAGCSAAVGKPMTVTLVGTPKLVLSTNADGSEATLQIRARGTAGDLTVRYRATVAGAATSLPAPLP
jgi:hypothetical protein